MIIDFQRFNSFVDNRQLTEESAEYLESVVRAINFNAMEIGTGSPEGVVTADPGKLYMDDGGVSGSILYIKKTGGGNTGWILV